MTLRELYRYSVLHGRLTRAEELLLSLREAARPGSPLLDGMPRAPGVKDKIGDLAAEIVDLTRRIQTLKEELNQEELKIIRFIDAIEDERLRMIFRLKFVRDLTWMQTAEILGENYNEESVKKLCYKYVNGD